MRIRIAIGGTALTLLIVAAIAAVSAASGSSATPAPFFRLQPGVKPAPALTPGLHNPRVLVLTLVSAQGSNVDQDPSGTSPGDSMTASGAVTADGKPAGTLDITGVTTSVGARSIREQFVLTVTLANGQISSIASVQETNGLKAFRAAVVGGTLRYRNVRGQLYVRLLQRGAQLTYRLQP
jgi:hypothetical protein